MSTVAGPVTVYKVVELDSRNNYLTLNFPWNGSRILPKNRKISAVQYPGRLGGRTLMLRGFSCFLRLSDAIDFFQRFEGDNYRLVRCTGIGVATHAEKQFQLASEITLWEIIEGIPAAPEELEESPGGESPGS